jgi:hydroxypyruvate isomerase
VKYSACIEWLFAAEAPEFTERIRVARGAGLDAVEFWHHSNKDLDAIEAALRDSAMPLAGLLCEPKAPLTDTAAHDAFLSGLETTLPVALRLGAKMVIAQAGDALAGLPRSEQHAAIVQGLQKAARLLEGSGVVLAIEPLNDRVDHPGYYLTSTSEGLDIIDEVDRPEIRLLYDIYHSAVMGEAIEEVLAGRIDRLAHVHLADAPGRGAPGSGKLDYRQRLEWLESAGYGGYVGLEYRPGGATLDGLAFMKGKRA